MAVLWVCGTNDTVSEQLTDEESVIIPLQGNSFSEPKSLLH